MSYLNKDTAATIVSVKITDNGRELLTKGLKEGDFFDVVKYSFGDSEINYNQDDAIIEEQPILKPSARETDLVNKIYYNGTVPEGDPILNVTPTEIVMSKNQGGIYLTVYTTWEPIDGVFNEEYKWTNLGPMNDWDFSLTTSLDTKVAILRSYDTVGTTRIRVKGLISGKYEIITLTIS